RVGLAVFILSLALRVTNVTLAFDHGVPQIAPTDELYHWKRMSYSTLHFPRVLELDGDRGTAGAFCPWPPLYDFASGAAARLLGARDRAGVLARVVWFPPLVAAMCAALAAAWTTRRLGCLDGIAAAIALRGSQF